MRALEKYKAFPYIAWITLFLFSLFTLSLVFDLQETIVELDERKQERNTKIEAGDV